MARVAKKSADNTTSAAVRKTRTKSAAQPAAKKGLSLKKARRGRPAGTTAKAANGDRTQRRDLREKVRAMQAELQSAMREQKAAVKRERTNTDAAKADLREALKRERALIKLIDSRDEAMRGFGNRWTKQRMAEIQKPPKKRKRRASAASTATTSN